MIPSNKLIIGRHISLTKPDYLLGVVNKAISLGCSSFSFFLGSPRSAFRLTSKELRKEEFLKVLSDNKINIKNVVIHAPYIINIASLDTKIFNFSISLLKKEIELMNDIGIESIVIHPGSCFSILAGLKQIVKAIDEILLVSSKVKIVVENMSCRSRIAGDFLHLDYIIRNVKQRDRVGICLDTCHLFAAGYDIKNNLEKVIEEFDSLIGLEKIWVMHINDSLRDFNEGIDRHENIGCGKIGFECLKKIVNLSYFREIPKILETPYLSDYLSLEEIEKFKKK